MIPEMGPEAWLTLAVLGAVLGMLVLTSLPADAVLAGAVVLLMLTGVISSEQALHGLANEGVITIGALFMVAAGLRETGGMSLLSERILGRPRSLLSAQSRLLLPAAALSAFMNNTPLVAMLMPVVHDWGRKLGLSASRLLMPLSYASILGGACTLIGTSTNLIVNGWLIAETDHPPLGMFEVAWVCLPAAVVGVAYMLITSRWLLPERQPLLDPREDPREYTVEVMVEAGGPLVGKTVEDAGLRHLPGLYLVEIEREDQVLPAVSANVKLRGDDRLVFVGVVESVLDLHSIRGLSAVDQQTYKLDVPRTNRTLIEAVVSNSSPMAGQTIREGGFRTRYKAVVIAVARNGERLGGKLGDIRLQAGDTLLMEGRKDFADRMRDSRDFFLVSAVAGYQQPNYDRAWISLLILGAMVLAVTAGWLSMLEASVLAVGAMLATGCCSVRAAREAVDPQVLLVIAAALGLGKALQYSGLAAALSEVMLGVVGSDPAMALAAVFAVTALLAGSITAKAAAVLVLPIAQVLAGALGVDFMPFGIAVMVAASTTIATPLGYPTNLMVMGPGGYRFRDYVVFGGPLTVIIGVISVLIIPMIWGF